MDVKVGHGIRQCSRKLMLLRCGVHSFIHLSSSRRRLTTMDFHLFLSSAILFASPYVLRPVHSVISSIHILLGLLLGFFPYILPSRIYRCVSPLECLHIPVSSFSYSS